MSWKRLGLVFVPDGAKPWARSHAALPLSVHLHDDVFRMFFSSRDAEKRSHVGWVDVQLSGSPRVVRVSSEPVLAPGEDGAFDDSGVGIGSIVRAGDQWRLYYMGWNLGVRTGWRNAIGFASASSLDGPFERYSAGPILDRSPEDPYTLSYPCVVQAGSHDWWMWYGSNMTASTDDYGMQHAIKMARSPDGVVWTRDGAPALGFRDAGEYAQARPSVVSLKDRRLMVFACRGSVYQIGAAISRHDEGNEGWVRCDDLFGLDHSSSGWDSEMVCYPAMFWHNETLWLAYCGNGYGATGFGLAVWDGALPENR